MFKILLSFRFFSSHLGIVAVFICIFPIPARSENVSLEMARTLIGSVAKVYDQHASSTVAVSVETVMQDLFQAIEKEVLEDQHPKVIQNLECLRGGFVPGASTCEDEDIDFQKDLKAILFATWANRKTIFFSDWSRLKKTEEASVRAVPDRMNLVGIQNVRDVFRHLEAWNNAPIVRPFVSYDEAYAFMEFVRSRDDLSFCVLEDGCFQRTELICSLARHLGIPCEGIVFDASELEVKTICVPGKVQKWVRHTAPVLMVSENGGVPEKFVLDLPLFVNPVRVERWLSMFSKREKPLGFRARQDVPVYLSHYYFFESHLDAPIDLVRNIQIRDEMRHHLGESRYRKSLQALIHSSVGSLVTSGDLDRLTQLAIDIDVKLALFPCLEACATCWRREEVNQAAWAQISLHAHSDPHLSAQKVFLLGLESKDWRVQLVSSLALGKISISSKEREDAFSQVFTIAKSLSDKRLVEFYVRALGSLGSSVGEVNLKQEAAEWICDELLSVPKDVKVPKIFYKALDKFGEVSAPLLLRMIVLEQGDLSQIAEVFRGLGCMASEYMPLLEEVIEKKPALRKFVVPIIPMLGPSGLAAALRMLEAKSDIEVETIEALGQAGSIAQEMVPVLWRKFHESTPLNQVVILEAIVKIGFKKEYIPELEKIMA